MSEIMRLISQIRLYQNGEIVLTGVILPPDKRKSLMLYYQGPAPERQAHLVRE